MSDDKTIEIYDRRAGDYAAQFGKAHEPDASLRAFIEAVPEGGHVLDLGCGPGTWARLLVEAGFSVDAFDASEGMVAEAAKIPGVNVWQGGFDQVTSEAEYDGIWANFSLLHASRDEMPTHLAMIRRALRPGGVVHIGLKQGTGAKRDDLGRFYTYYEVEELTGLLADQDLTAGPARTGSDKGLDGVVAPWFTLLAHA